MALVTLAVFSYNQERFIRDAIVGALSQDYQNLEIIFSDDCSSDKTFEIIERLVLAYRGNHKIILNRNSTNLGLPNHLNKVVKLVSGDLIVVAAGDDISLPNRVSILASKWIAHGCPDGLVFSDVTNIDESGSIVRANSPIMSTSICEYASRFDTIIHGATPAYTTSIFRNFGPLPSNCFSEDRILSFRALLLGDILFVKDRLVMYRKTSNSLSNNYNYNDFGFRLLSVASEYLKVIDQHKVDALAHLDKPNVAKALLRLAQTESTIVKCIRHMHKSNLIDKLVVAARFPGYSGILSRLNLLFTYFELRDTMLYRKIRGAYFYLKR